MASNIPHQGQDNAPQLMACSKCGALNKLSASYCLNCGSVLPLPVGHPSYRPAVPQPRTGLSVPAILLIVSVLMLVIVLAFLMIAFAVQG